MQQVVLPMQQVVPSKIRHIHEYLSRQPFQYFSGYPSIIHSFTAAALELGFHVTGGPAAVFTGAEKLHSFQRQSIEAYAPGSVVTEQYGMSEGAANASECEQLRLHEDFEFGVMQLADAVHNVSTGRSTGDIVATAFNNPSFPLIRYRIGDSATWEEGGPRCPCGRSSRLIASIDGRSEDYVLTPEGHRVMRFDYIFKGIETIRSGQVAQTTHDSIEIAVVPTADFAKVHEEALISNVHAWISPNLRVTVKTVGSIPPGPSGKFQAVIGLES